MDANNKELTKLLDNTDIAFQRLLENPFSDEFSDEYENAKQKLDFYLSDLREELSKKYSQY